jgi:hypothetical protein
MEAGTAGDDDDSAISGKPERKGISKLVLPLAPLDALLRQVDVLFEAHLLGLLSVAGMA